MTDDFRPCPSYPGYSAAKNGLVRRDVLVCKGGDRPALVLRRYGSSEQYVSVNHRQMSWRAMLLDAWPELDALTINPAEQPVYRRTIPSTIPGGRVMRIEEWAAMMRAKSR